MISIPPATRSFYFQRVQKVPEQPFPAHYHNWFEFYYITFGSCNYFIDDKTYQVHPGDIVLIPPKVIHKANYNSALHSRMLINCPAEWLPECVRELLTKDVTLLKSIPDADEIDRILRNISIEYNKSEPYSEALLQAYVQELFICIARRIDRAETIESEMSYTDLAIRYIKSNYMRKIYLDEVAKYCKVSAAYLSRSFKNEIGMSFTEYLTLFRLNSADVLMTSDPDRSVTDIAYQCGFNDSNYFSYVYKKAFGHSPMSKKKSLKQELSLFEK